LHGSGLGQRRDDVRSVHPRHEITMAAGKAKTPAGARHARRDAHELLAEIRI
jgi:hypothetical protein